MKCLKKKGYLLIIYSYMEEETHFYNSINELLKDWHCKSLNQFFKNYDAIIFHIEREIIGD